ncbi:hypothetical protein J2R98_001172 [Alkalibacillus filiformis]|uniref:Uncharacterized protein n=1 Tax=Alkalibacillus filiformis TaxID=200990 RepID=A0ABU0DSQ7_9BACI|nr:hypothetical protein [Alkalibacillus filiformis]
MKLEITRTINCPTTKTIPVNTITVSILKGLNHEGFGGVINPVPKITDIIIITAFATKKYKGLTLNDSIPTIITRNNNNVFTNMKEASSPLMLSVVSKKWNKNGPGIKASINHKSLIKIPPLLSLNKF